MDRHDMMCKYTLHIALEKNQNKCHHFVMAKVWEKEGLPDFPDFWKCEKYFIILRNILLMPLTTP